MELQINPTWSSSLTIQETQVSNASLMGMIERGFLLALIAIKALSLRSCLFIKVLNRIVFAS